MTPYNHHWRTVVRPHILQRAGGIFENGDYKGCARCERCGRPDALLSVYQHSELDIAHLDGDRLDDDALAALCRKCHRALDYAEWAAKFSAWVRAERDRRAAEADSHRPILVYLQEAV